MYDIGAVRIEKRVLFVADLVPPLPKKARRTFRRRRGATAAQGERKWRGGRELLPPSPDYPLYVLGTVPSAFELIDGFFWDDARKNQVS